MVHEERQKVREISEEELAIFGLTEAEARVVIGLNELGPTRVSRLSRKVGIPHTTIHAALRRLKEQGLVRRVSRGYSSVWKVVSPEKIQKAFHRAFEPLGGDVTRENLEKNLGIEVAESPDFFVFKGVAALLKMYQWFFLNHRATVVRNIQTSRSLAAMQQKLDAETMAQLCDIPRTNRVSVDAVLGEEMEGLFRENIVQNNVFFKSILERNNSTTLLPGSFLTSNVDILMAKDTGFIANWENETLILIKNPDFTDFLYSLFGFLHHAGRLFDRGI